MPLYNLDCFPLYMVQDGAGTISSVYGSVPTSLVLCGFFWSLFGCRLCRCFCWLLGLWRLCGPWLS